MPNGRLAGDAARDRARIDRLMPALRRDVLRALEALQGRVSVSALLDALEQHDEFAVRGLTSRLPADLRPAIATLRNAFTVGAAGAAAAIARPLQGRLDLVSRDMVAAAQRSAAQLVTRVTAETRQAIRRIIVRAFKDGIPPREAAKLIKPLIGLTERQAMAVLALRARRVRQGWDAGRILAEAQRYSARLLRQRAETIARTEIIQSSVDGQLAIWQQAKRDGLIPSTARKHWIVTPDDRLCPNCRQMRGPRAVVALDALFDTPLGLKTGPTMHPNCRCALRLTFEATGRRREAA